MSTGGASGPAACICAGTAVHQPNHPLAKCTHAAAAGIPPDEAAAKGPLAGLAVQGGQGGGDVDGGLARLRRQRRRQRACEAWQACGAGQQARRPVASAQRSAAALRYAHPGSTQDHVGAGDGHLLLEHISAGGHHHRGAARPRCLGRRVDGLLEGGGAVCAWGVGAAAECEDVNGRLRRSAAAEGLATQCTAHPSPVLIDPCQPRHTHPSCRRPRRQNRQR